MRERFKMGKIYPPAYKAMDALEALMDNSLIDKWHRNMIRIRASQINGCAYCVNYHSIDAVKAGADLRKINLIAVWREAKNVFNEEEQLLIRMTEEITLISQQGLVDATYDAAISLYGEERTAQIIMLIITINAWNRIGVGLEMKPEL